MYRSSNKTKQNKLKNDLTAVVFFIWSSEYDRWTEHIAVITWVHAYRGCEIRFLTKRLARETKQRHFLQTIAIFNRGREASASVLNLHLFK
jgi:hypothetical protein